MKRSDGHLHRVMERITTLISSFQVARKGAAMENIISNNRVALRRLTITLLLTGLCSQLPVVGVMVAALALFAGSFKNFMNEGVPEPLSPSELAWLSILWIITLAVLA